MKEASRFMAVVFALMLIIFLSNRGNTETYREEHDLHMRGDLPKIISVVKTPQPPAIDGVMEPGEWDYATIITGLSEVSGIAQWGVGTLKNMANHQSTFFITYDDNNLYIAHHSPPPPSIQDMPAMIAVMLRRNETVHDANVERDDSIHISFIDPVYPGGDKYVIQLNSIGAIFECIWNYPGYTWEEKLMEKQLGRVPGITLSWDPPVINAANLTLDGWTIELAIPWDGLGPHIKKPVDGEVKHMNFGRIWKEIMDQAHAWKAHGQRSPAGQVRFSGEEGIIVRLTDTGSLPRGQASFSAEIQNAFSDRRTLIAEVTTNSGELYDAREISLLPGEHHVYEYTGFVGDFATTKIAFSIKDAETEEIVHLTTLPVIRPQEPAISTRRYRGMDKMKFETDMTFMGSADMRRARVVLTVRNKESGRRVFRRTYRGFTSHQAVFELSTGDWEPGNYEATFVFSAPGMRNYTATQDYYHPELPGWWNNRYGLEDIDTDRVPYPWTSMSVNNGTIYVWGRRYAMDSSLLPSQLTTLGYPMLRAPMRILLETSAGESIISSEKPAEVEWHSLKHTRVEGASVLRGRDLKLENSFWAEYDGLMWNALTINPLTDIEITSMILEIPLTSEFTDVINAYDYSLRNTGLLKDTGFVSEPTKPVWLGNAEGGIQWFCETNGWFFVKDELKSLRVDVENGEATLRITMIDIPTTFKTPHEIQFGFTVTPVRPKTWRTPEHSRYRDVRGGMFADLDNMFVPALENAQSGLYVTTRVIAPTEEFLLYADEWRDDPNSRSNSVTMASESFRNYFAWRHWRRQHRKVCGDRADNCRGFIHLYYDVSGDVRSINPYVGTGYRRRDGTMAPTLPLLEEREITRRLYNIALSNPESHPRDQWIGYHQSAMPHMAYMSFANENWDSENFNSVINEQQPTYLGVVDPAMFRAEHMGHNWGWPLVFLGQGRIRPEWAERAGGAEAVIDHLHGLQLLHDNQPGNWHFRGPNERVVDRTIDNLERHNFSHWKYRFLPYWKQDIVELPKQGMYASFYIARPSELISAFRDYDSDTRQLFLRNRAIYPKIAEYFGQDLHLPARIMSYNVGEVMRQRRAVESMKDKVIMIVYNDTHWEGQMRLSPDWEKIGIGSPDTLTAENAIHSTGFRLEMATDDNGNKIEQPVFFERQEEYARIEGRELVFPMTRYNYRMIVLEKR